VWSAKTAKVRVNLVETDLNAHGNWDLAIMSVPTPGRPLRKVAGTQFNSRQVSTFLLNVPPGRYLALLVNRVLGDNIWADTQFLSELFPFAVQFQADAEEQFNLAVPLIPAETLSVVMANAGFDPSGTRAVDFPR
jgi:hypothetical protein